MSKVEHLNMQQVVNETNFYLESISSLKYKIVQIV